MYNPEEIHDFVDKSWRIFKKCKVLWINPIQSSRNWFCTRFFIHFLCNNDSNVQFLNEIETEICSYLIVVGFKVDFPIGISIKDVQFEQMLNDGIALRAKNRVKRVLIWLKILVSIEITIELKWFTSLLYLPNYY